MIALREDVQTAGERGGLGTWAISTPRRPRRSASPPLLGLAFSCIALTITAKARSFCPERSASAPATPLACGQPGFPRRSPPDSRPARYKGPRLARDRYILRTECRHSRQRQRQVSTHRPQVLDDLMRELTAFPPCASGPCRFARLPSTPSRQRRTRLTSLRQPTLNPDSSMLVKDWVLLNRYAALAAQQGYKDTFKPGDVVALK